MTSRSTSIREKTIETAIKSYLFKNGVYFIKVHGSAFMSSGIPDILCCVNGNFVGIEVKRTGAKNTQSDFQKVHEENIKKSGGVYLLVDSLKEVEEYFNEKFYNNK